MTLVRTNTRSGDHRWPPHVVYHRRAGVAPYTLLDLLEGPAAIHHDACAAGVRVLAAGPCKPVPRDVNAHGLHVRARMAWINCAGAMCAR
jgi:hypothetical protein